MGSEAKGLVFTQHENYIVSKHTTELQEKTNSINKMVERIYELEKNNIELTKKKEDYKAKVMVANERFDEITKLRKRVEYLTNKNKKLSLEFENYSTETNKTWENKILKLKEEIELEKKKKSSFPNNIASYHDGYYKQKENVKHMEIQIKNLTLDFEKSTKELEQVLYKKTSLLNQKETEVMDLKKLLTSFQHLQSHSVRHKQQQQQQQGFGQQQLGFEQQQWVGEQQYLPATHGAYQQQQQPHYPPRHPQGSWY